MADENAREESVRRILENIILSQSGHDRIESVPTLNIVLEIRYIHGIFQRMVALEDLRIRSSHLQKIQNLERCDRLRILDLSHNIIKSLDPISVMENLEIVIMDFNPILQISPATFERSKKIHTLSLRNTTLRGLMSTVDALRTLPNLTHLSFQTSTRNLISTSTSEAAVSAAVGGTSHQGPVADGERAPLLPGPPGPSMGVLRRRTRGGAETAMDHYHHQQMMHGGGEDAGGRRRERTQPQQQQGGGDLATSLFRGVGRLFDLFTARQRHPGAEPSGDLPASAFIPPPSSFPPPPPPAATSEILSFLPSDPVPDPSALFPASASALPPAMGARVPIHAPPRNTVFSWPSRFDSFAALSDQQSPVQLSLSEPTTTAATGVPILITPQNENDEDGGSMSTRSSITLSSSPVFSDASFHQVSFAARPAQQMGSSVLNPLLSVTPSGVHLRLGEGEGGGHSSSTAMSVNQPPAAGRRYGRAPSSIAGESEGGQSWEGENFDQRSDVSHPPPTLFGSSPPLVPGVAHNVQFGLRSSSSSMVGSLSATASAAGDDNASNYALSLAEVKSNDSRPHDEHSVDFETISNYSIGSSNPNNPKPPGSVSSGRSSPTSTSTHANVINPQPSLISTPVVGGSLQDEPMEGGGGSQEGGSSIRDDGEHSMMVAEAEEVEVTEDNMSQDGGGDDSEEEEAVRAAVPAHLKVQPPLPFPQSDFENSVLADLPNPPTPEEDPRLYQWQHTDTSPITRCPYYREYVIHMLPGLMTLDGIPITQWERKRAEAVFSSKFETYANRRTKANASACLASREIGRCLPLKSTSPLKDERKNTSVEFCAIRMRRDFVAGLASKPRFGRMCESRPLPRQFEYHPSLPDQLVLGTILGEVVVLDHESNTIVAQGRVGQQDRNILGLCWMKSDPTKFVAGCDTGEIALFDVNGMKSRATGGAVYQYEPFPGLTSVHVNSTDDLFITSGYCNDVGVYDLREGRKVQSLQRLHTHEHINVVKFANHSPHLFCTSSFDKSVKMWDIRQPLSSGPIYTRWSNSGNVMVCFSSDDKYILSSAVDNEVRQYLAVDGTPHLLYDTKKMNSGRNYTRSYYLNDNEYIVVGSCEESIVRLFNSSTGALFREVDVSTHLATPDNHFLHMYIQSLRGDPFRDFHFSVLVAYNCPGLIPSQLLKVNLLGSAADGS